MESEGLLYNCDTWGPDARDAQELIPGDVVDLGLEEAKSRWIVTDFFCERLGENPRRKFLREFGLPRDVAYEISEKDRKEEKREQERSNFERQYHASRINESREKEVLFSTKSLDKDLVEQNSRLKLEVVRLKDVIKEYEKELNKWRKLYRQEMS